MLELQRGAAREVVARTSPLAAMIKAALLAVALGIVILSAVAFMGIESLRSQVGRWALTDDLGQAQIQLARVLEASISGKEPADVGAIDHAFDKLETTVLRQEMETGLAQTLAHNIEAARSAFQENEIQRKETAAAIVLLERASNNASTILGQAVASVRDSERLSNRTTIALGREQHRKLGLVREVVNAIVAAERVKVEVATLSEFPAIASNQAGAISLDGIPKVCDEATSSPKENLCQPSSARVHARIESLNTEVDATLRADLATRARWAVDAYLRSLRARFEKESADLARRVDEVEREREMTAHLSRRLIGLSRGRRALINVRQLVDKLPRAAPDQIVKVERQMHGVLSQVRVRTIRMLDSSENIELDSLPRMDFALAELTEAWAIGVKAVRAEHAASESMQLALNRMKLAISTASNNIRIEAETSISRFVSSAVLALALVGVAVCVGALFAYRRVALPIARVTGTIHELANGGISQPLEKTEGGRALGGLFEALEILRRSTLATKHAEENVAKAAQALEQAHDRLARIANNAPVGLFEFRRDANGWMTFPYRSEKFDELFGIDIQTSGASDALSEAEVADMVHATVDSAFRSSMMDSVQQSAESMEPWRARLLINHPTRGQRWISGTSSPVRQSDDAIQWIGTLMDVTDQVTFESQLHLARERAEAANHAKSTFLANMSHEIRTPMNGIMGMCELLQQTRLSDEQNLCARTISESAQSLLAIINDVLDFSKVEAGKLSIKSAEFSMSELVYNVYRLLYSKARDKGLELFVDYRDACETRIGDDGRVRQILLNLLSNAVKFTDSGAIVVRIDSNPNGGVDVVVSDTGIGIDKNHIESIFRPFEQMDNEQTRVHDGTGLGLAITSQLVDLMGGSIDVQSTIGEGSEFTVSLPLQATGRAASSRGLVEKSVLVLENSSFGRQILASQLEQLGAYVEIVDSWAKAVQAIGAGRDSSFEVAIVDSEYLSRHAEHPDLPAATERIPILLHVPVDYALDAEVVDAIGVVDCIRRPASQDDIFRAVSSALDHRLPRPMTNSSGDSQSTLLGLSEFSTKPRVLAAEDNHTNQLLLKRMLQQYPIELEIFENGQEIYEAYSRSGADLIFMDMSMPVMDGLEATQHIRRFEQRNQLGPCPIIALTANALAQHKEACEAAGMTGFLTKPFKKQELCDAVEELFASRSGVAQVA